MGDLLRPNLAGDFANPALELGEDLRPVGVPDEGLELLDWGLALALAFDSLVREAERDVSDAEDEVGLLKTGGQDRRLR